MLQLLKSKIHRARVTMSVLANADSLAVDSDLLAMAGITPYEKVLVTNISSGARLDAYVIGAAPGSGCLSLNGALARCGSPGDELTIMAFAWVPEDQAESVLRTVLVLDENNQVLTTDNPS